MMKGLRIRQRVWSTPVFLLRKALVYSEFRSATRERTFHFSLESAYRALGYRNEQFQRVLEYQQENGISGSPFAV